MGAAACSSSSDSVDDTSSEAEQGLSSGATYVENRTYDAEDGLVGAAPVEAPASDSATTDARSEPAEEATDGGFFAAEAALAESAGTFQDYGVRPFVETSQDPFSTFALDVDTGSYTVGRQFLNNNQLPPADSVRVEEYVNAFDYDYRAPANGLGMEAEGGPSPFDADNVLVRVGVQAMEVANEDRPDASLVFVVDTSGSMDRDNRLGLVRRSLDLLVRELDDDDTVAIVTYSSNAEVLLEPTSVRDEDTILNAIRSLRPNGSTNLEAGLEKGYQLANEAYVSGGINRVVLASDGIANVGLTDPTALSAMIRDDADEGIQLVTVGVGMTSYNDVVMEQLADDGDGFYAYVDTDEEAAVLFGDELVGTLLTVAIDGKIQVEFNEATVSAYRLIGFENRAVLDNDFRNDAVDAGELGAGHQVSAVYELTLKSGVSARDTLGTAALRWEDPDTGSVTESRLEIAASVIEDRWQDTSDSYRLAVTVATFAEVLRDSPFAKEISLEQISAEADSLASTSGEASEFAELVRQALRISS